MPGKRPIAPFDGVNFDALEPVPLKPEHGKLSRSFQCEGRGFRTQLGKEIPVQLKQLLCTGWALPVGKKHLAGFITICADEFRLLTTNGQAKLIAIEDAHLTTIPAVKILIVARDRRAPGAGRRLLTWTIDYIIRELVPRLGVRFITLNAYYQFVGHKLEYDTGSYYEREYGFRFVDPDAKPTTEGEYRSMYLDLLPTVKKQPKITSK